MIKEEKLHAYSTFSQCSDEFVAILDSAFATLELANMNASKSNNMSTGIMITDLVLLIMVTVFWSIKYFGCCKNKDTNADFGALKANVNDDFCSAEKEALMYVAPTQNNAYAPPMVQ
jgi:hypothetical protein